jgi:lipoic acid synthetase
MFNHNIETVANLYSTIRPQASYRRSLDVLEYAASKGLRVKSGIMVGLGETDSEIQKTLLDIWLTGCRHLTIGQYLAPSKNHLPIVRYVTPKTFCGYAEIARRIGFVNVASGPLVRSSYRAAEMSHNKQIRYDERYYGAAF